MKHIKLIVLCILVFNTLSAQKPVKTDPFPKAAAADTIIRIKDKSVKTKLFPSLIVPALLIGYGLSTLKGNGFYSSYRAKEDIQRVWGKNRSKIDDYLIYAPYCEFAVLILLKQKCQNDMINTLLLIAKSEAIMVGLVYTLKYTTKMRRPDGSDTESFPSGHTAEAFVAATVVYREYRYKSAWYGIGAYTLASAVGVYRMINNKHWQSDVLVGAGIGILSANLVYATHLHKWGRKAICIVPAFDGKSKGLAMTMNF